MTFQKQGDDAERRWKQVILSHAGAEPRGLGSAEENRGDKSNITNNAAELLLLTPLVLLPHLQQSPGVSINNSSNNKTAASAYRRRDYVNHNNVLC